MSNDNILDAVKKANEERAALVETLKARLVANEAEAVEIKAALRGLVPRTRGPRKAKEEAEG